MKYKRRDIFRLLDRDCVSPVTRKIVEDYINNLIRKINDPTCKSKDK